jgi:uncharacterized protein YwgA
MGQIHRDFQKVIAILNKCKVELRNPKVKKNFQSRLIIQKIIFLSKFQGITMNRYKFSLYKNGPYSPDLTADYYNNYELVTSLETDYHLTPKEQEIVEKLNRIVLEHPLNKYNQADLLEAVSTAYYIKDYDEHLLDDDLFEKIKEEKPFINAKIIINAINLVKKLRFKQEYITKEIQDEVDVWDKAED